jgi:hypothetical protein
LTEWSLLAICYGHIKRIIKMTNNTGTGPSAEKTHKDVVKLSSKFNRIVRRAQSVLFVERAWPRLVGPLSTTGLFLSASWAGAWQGASPEVKIASLLGFTAAFFASPFLIKNKKPLKVSEEDALKYIDAKIDDPSRPAQTLHDEIADEHPPMGQHLWDLHLKQTWDKWSGNLKTGFPKIDLGKNAPFNIRFAVLAATIATATLAGEQRQELVAEAFDWSRPPPPMVITPVTAWITPPDNIEAPEIRLTENDQNKINEDALAVHEQSTLTVLIHGKETEVLVNGFPLEVKDVLNKSSSSGTTYEYETTLTEEKVTIYINNGSENGLNWEFNVTPDDNPLVNINEVTQNEENPNILDINCSAEDDFGIKEGEISIKPLNQDPNATPLPSGTIPPIKLPKHALCK